MSLQSQAEVVEGGISTDNTETLVVSANYYRQKYLNLLHYQLTILKNLEVSTRPQTIQFTASTPFCLLTLSLKPSWMKTSLNLEKIYLFKLFLFGL